MRSPGTTVRRPEEGYYSPLTATLALATGKVLSSSLSYQAAEVLGIGRETARVLMRATVWPPHHRQYRNGRHAAAAAVRRRLLAAARCAEARAGA